MGTTTDPMMPNLTPRLGPCFRKLIENLESARKHKKVEEYQIFKSQPVKKTNIPIECK